MLVLRVLLGWENWRNLRQCPHDFSTTEYLNSRITTEQSEPGRTLTNLHWKDIQIVGERQETDWTSAYLYLVRREEGSTNQKNRETVSKNRWITKSVNWHFWRNLRIANAIYWVQYFVIIEEEYSVSDYWILSMLSLSEREFHKVSNKQYGRRLLCQTQNSTRYLCHVRIVSILFQNHVKNRIEIT